MGVERHRKIVVLSYCLVVVFALLRPPPATHPSQDPTNSANCFYITNRPPATHPSQVPTNSPNCFYVTNRPPRPTHRKLRPIQPIAFISRTARRDPPIARSDQFSQLLLHHGPPAATHPSQEPNNSVKGFYITDRPPRPTHGKSRPTHSMSFIIRPPRPTNRKSRKKCTHTPPLKLQNVGARTTQILRPNDPGGAGGRRHPN